MFDLKEVCFLFCKYIKIILTVSINFLYSKGINKKQPITNFAIGCFLPVNYKLILIPTFNFDIFKTHRAEGIDKCRSKAGIGE